MVRRRLGRQLADEASIYMHQRRLLTQCCARDIPAAKASADELGSEVTDPPANKVKLAFEQSSAPPPEALLESMGRIQKRSGGRRMYVLIANANA